jgi:Flp pilus assembly protein TadD
MLHNLLALLAVVDGDMAGAETQFRMADLIPGALPGAYGTVSLNRALLAVGARQPAEARRWFQKGQAETKTVHLPGWGAQMSMLSALIAWSDGNQAQAETLLRSAIAAQPTDQKPHAYLAELLAAHGDTAGAAEQRAEALAMRQLTPRIPSLAQSEFWVDPANGGLQLRQ